MTLYDTGEVSKLLPKTVWGHMAERLHCTGLVPFWSASYAVCFELNKAWLALIGVSEKQYKLGIKCFKCVQVWIKKHSISKHQ